MKELGEVSLRETSGERRVSGKEGVILTGLQVPWEHNTRRWLELREEWSGAASRETGSADKAASISRETSSWWPKVSREHPVPEEAATRDITLSCDESDPGVRAQGHPVVSAANRGLRL